MLGYLLMDKKTSDEAMVEGLAAAANRRRRTHLDNIMESRSRDSFTVVIDEKDAIIAQLKQELDLALVGRNAFLGALKQVANYDVPENKNRACYLSSRHFDAQLDKLLAEGIIKSDPRQDKAWRELQGYRPV